MTPEEELQNCFNQKLGMFDSFSADQASEVDPDDGTDTI